MSVEANLTSNSSSTAEHARFSAAMKGLIQYNIPAHLLTNEEDGSKAEDQEELDQRHDQEKRLIRRRKTASSQLKQAENEFNEFQDLLEAYKVADGMKDPSGEHAQAITNLNASIVDVVAANGTGTVIARQIAAKSLALKKQLDEAQAEYDRVCKEYTQCQEQITVLKTRLGKSSTSRTAIQNGRMAFLAGYESESTFRSVKTCVQDIWAMVEGTGMLELNYNNILTAVKRLRRSLQQQVASTDRYSDEHRNAVINQSAVDECLEALGSTYGRGMSKRQIVNHLSFICFSDQDRQLLVRWITRHSGGSTKRCFDTPCVDCPGGLRMSQVLNPAGKKTKGPTKKNQNQKQGNQPAKKKNKTEGQRWPKGSKPNYQNFGNSQNLGTGAPQAGQFYCNMHGHGSTHSWERCHLNQNGPNFKPEKLKAWNERQAALQAGSGPKPAGP